MTPKHKWYVMLSFCVLDVDYYYNYNMNSVGYQLLTFKMCSEFITGCVSKSGDGVFFFWVNGLFLANTCIIYKTLYEEVKVIGDNFGVPKEGAGH